MDHIKGLIGYTGFIGGNLQEQIKFDHFFNSKNINEAVSINFDEIICAAPSAVKWKANANPEEDWHILSSLMDNIKNIQTNLFIQISTIDVYPDPVDVNETSLINLEISQPYGRHRYLLEQFIKEHFSNHIIIRLPALFGNGLKKNFIFDLMHNNCLHLTHKESQFQYFYLNNLLQIIEFAKKNNITLLNVTSPPIQSEILAKDLFNTSFDTITEKKPVKYDVKSIYSSLLEGEDGYLISKKQTYEDLHDFIKRWRDE